jgi:hypothetical protein
MTARPVFVKLAAFFFAFAAAVALVAVFTPAPPRRVVVPRERPEFVLAENLESKVELISLDREAGRSYTRLRLRLVGGSRAPEKLWVRTHFFNPSAAWLRVPAGDPVAVERPFGGGSPASVIVTAACPWCNDAAAPGDGYFANVEIYEHDYQERPHTLGSQFVDLTTAVPVVVHADRASSRRR